ncbi:MAG: lytic murein transglycosylase B [Arenicellales bacterium]
MMKTFLITSAKRVALSIGVSALFAASLASAVSLEKYPQLGEMAARLNGINGLSEAQVKSWFEQAKIETKIIDAMNRPAERLEWHRYQSLFVNPASVNGGVQFMKANWATLERAANKFGVPAEIIVAIIGVETRYGKILGSLRVLDSLVTLSVEYPRRSKFFSSELEHFMKLTAEQGMDPTSIKGSYAGAMGIPQFMPSSYRDYAVDFDGDKRADLINSVDDAIGSVANYLSRYGWKKAGLIVTRVEGRPAGIEDRVTKKLKANASVKDVRALGISVSGPGDENVGVLRFDADGGPDYRIGHHNFFVITRYNRSQNYAMSVFELAEQIAVAAQN